MDKTAEIDAEIERIRKRCDVEFRVNLDKVHVKGHKRKLDEFEESFIEKSFEVNKGRHPVYDSEDEVKEIKIKKVGVRRKKQGEDN